MTMANYSLTGIDDEQWRHFKANCDIIGITIKEALLIYIEIVSKDFKDHPQYDKLIPIINARGGKKS
jgi:hypothetical protein